MQKCAKKRFDTADIVRDVRYRVNQAARLNFQKRLSGLLLLRSLYVPNQSSHASSKAKRFTGIESSSFSSILPHKVNKAPLPVFTLSIAVIEERGNEFSENMRLNVTEYWSTITAVVSGRETINTENRAIGIEKIQRSRIRTAATRKAAPTTK